MSGSMSTEKGHDQVTPTLTLDSMDDQISSTASNQSITSVALLKFCNLQAECFCSTHMDGSSMHSNRISRHHASFHFEHSQAKHDFNSTQPNNIST